jgi:hypothetical protein
MAKRGKSRHRAVEPESDMKRSPAEEYICSCTACLAAGNNVNDPVLGTVQGKLVGKNELIQHRKLEAANRRAEQLHGQFSTNAQGDAWDHRLVDDEDY